MTMKNSFVVHMWHCASLEISQVEQDVLKLLFNKLHLVLMKNSAAKRRLNAHVWRENGHAKKLYKKTSPCIDANAASLYLLPLSATEISYRTENPTNDNARLRLTISQTLYCWYYCLAARKITIRQAQLTCHYRRLQRWKLVTNISLHVMSPATTVNRHCRDWRRMEHCN